MPSTLLTLDPARGDHGAALRLMVGVAVPVAMLLVIGHPELVLYAVCGGFAGMYGRGLPRLRRLRHQLAAGGMVLVGIVLGVLASAVAVPRVQFVVLVACFAALASGWADHVRFRPVGPFFAIFAIGACGATPLPVEPGVAILTGLGSMAVSWLIGIATWGEHELGALAPIRQRRRLYRSAGYALAVGGAGLVAAGSHVGHPHWAMAAAAVPLAADGWQGKVDRAVHRLAGTLLGVALAAAIFVVHPGPLGMALLVVALQFPTEQFYQRHHALALVFFTPLILLMTQLAHPVPRWTLLLDRSFETVIGVAVGLVVVLLHRSRRGQASAADTTALASSCTWARCSGPRNDSA